jgi:hypothetical protein
MSETMRTDGVAESDAREAERDDPSTTGKPEIPAFGDEAVRGSEPSAGRPGEAHYVYRVVVDGERDDDLIASAEPIPIEAEVPFRGRTVIVEEIQDLHETDASGRDLAERIEAQPKTQLVRALICREAVQS